MMNNPQPPSSNVVEASSRITWHNCEDGQPVWFPYRGTWRAGTVVHRKQQFVTVQFEAGNSCFRAAERRYEELRNRKPKLEGRDKPADLGSAE